MFFCLNQADPDTLPITLTEDTSSSSSVIPSGVDPAVVMPAETSSTSPILPEETSVSSGVPSGVDPAVVTHKCRMFPAFSEAGEEISIDGS